MTLVRYNPLTNFVPGTFGDLMESALNESRSRAFKPQADITRDEKAISLYLNVPGMDKKDFSIDLNESKLTISGEREMKELENRTFLKRETAYGEFSRSFQLSDDINREEIDAAYENGILKVTLPLIEKKINKAVIKVK